jgi:hypothetical protein
MLLIFNPPREYSGKPGERETADCVHRFVAKGPLSHL